MKKIYIPRLPSIRAPVRASKTAGWHVDAACLEGVSLASYSTPLPANRAGGTRRIAPTRDVGVGPNLIKLILDSQAIRLTEREIRASCASRTPQLRQCSLLIESRIDLASLSTLDRTVTDRPFPAQA